MNGGSRKERRIPVKQAPSPLIVFDTQKLNLTTGAYQWQVTDFDGDKPIFSETAYFSIRVPGRVKPIRPIRRSFAGLIGLQFVWEDVEGGATHYQFQLWKEGVKIKDTGWQIPGAFTKANQYEVTYNLAAYGSGAYQWQVRAKNGAGSGGWSQVKNQISALGKPVIKSPPDGSFFDSPIWVLLQWTRIPNATRYQVGFWQNNVFSPEPLVTPTDNNLQSYLYFQQLGVWECKVRALDMGYGPWSVARTYSGY